MKKLPVGLQDFAKIREGNYVYVDKTKDILSLITDSTYVFFSRPRRFGKSLLCSTLKYLYEGRRELFTGLYIEDKIDWEEIKHSVIYIDFSEAVFKEMPLNVALQTHLKSIGDYPGISIINDSTTANFQHFIQYLAKQGRKPVVIVMNMTKH